MPYLDSNTPSNIYDAYKGSEISGFLRTTSDSNTFITFSTQLLKKIRNRALNIDPQNPF